MSLKQFVQKIKSFYQSYFKIIILILVIVLVPIDIYLLGFLSNYQKDLGFQLVFEPKLEIDFEKIKSIDNKVNEKNLTKNIVASKNGTKYYFIWCSGVERIKVENRVYFDTEDQAKLAGYDLAKNCFSK